MGIVRNVRSWFSGDEVRAAIMGAVVGGIIALVASIVVASQQIDAAREQTLQQIAAQRDQGQREKRAAVYSDYLLAAQGWADKRYAHVLCNCVPQHELFSAFNELRRQDINVGIFGTLAAREAELNLARSIPDSWPENTTGGAVDRNKPFDLNKYAEATAEFIHVMCVELPTLPNERC